MRGSGFVAMSWCLGRNTAARDCSVLKIGLTNVGEATKAVEASAKRCRQSSYPRQRYRKVSQTRLGDLPKNLTSAARDHRP
jgi:hypothetical protein